MYRYFLWINIAALSAYLLHPTPYQAHQQNNEGGCDESIGTGTCGIRIRTGGGPADPQTDSGRRDCRRHRKARKLRIRDQLARYDGVLRTLKPLAGHVAAHRGGVV